MNTTLDAHIEAARARFTREAWIRYSTLLRLHGQWITEVQATEQDWHDRAETIFSPVEAHLIRRHVLTDMDRLATRQALDQLPSKLRQQLDLQQHRLGNLQTSLGAESRRRIAEVRCWLYDALSRLDELDVYECRKMLVDALHSLEFMLNSFTNHDRPARNRLEFDTRLREQVQVVIDDLRSSVRSLA